MRGGMGEERIEGVFRVEGGRDGGVRFGRGRERESGGERERVRERERERERQRGKKGRRERKNAGMV